MTLAAMDQIQAVFQDVAMQNVLFDEHLLTMEDMVLLLLPLVLLLVCNMCDCAYLLAMHTLPYSDGLCNSHSRAHKQLPPQTALQKALYFAQLLLLFAHNRIEHTDVHKHCSDCVKHGSALIAILVKL